MERRSLVALVLAAAFATGAGLSAVEADAVTVATVLSALLSGLGAVFVIWAPLIYVTEHRPEGGPLATAVFLAPLVAAVVAAGAVWYTGGRVEGTIWAGFWAFVAVVFVIAVSVQFVAGYREAA
ncbi:MAG: hypothetical protein ABEJ68_03965 [Halobacteriaceae archaeon]